MIIITRCVNRKPTSVVLAETLYLKLLASSIESLVSMGSKGDYRCRPALAHLLQMATRQAMQASHVRDPLLMQTVMPTARRVKGVDPEEESFLSSEGDVSLLPDVDHAPSHSLLFSDLYRSCYTQCSERQVLMGKVFEQVAISVLCPLPSPPCCHWDTFFMAPCLLKGIVAHCARVLQIRAFYYKNARVRACARTHTLTHVRTHARAHTHTHTYIKINMYLLEC